MPKGRPKKVPVRIKFADYWWCPGCEEYRHEKHFGHCSRSSNGLWARCKDCRQKRQKLGRPPRVPRTRAGKTEWLCSCCRRWKVETEFGKRKPPLKGVFSWCKLCVRKDSAARRLL